MKAKVLSGSASKYGAIRSRSADHVRVRAQDLELLVQRRLGPVLADLDRGQRIDPIRGAVLERQLTGLLEQHVDHHSLRRSEDHVVDELLVLDVAAVAADQLHPRPRQRDLEDAGVGGVGQVEAHDLAELRLTATARSRR